MHKLVFPVPGGPCNKTTRFHEMICGFTFESENNIAVMAYQAKGTARTELALSSYALARINQIVQGGSSLPVVVSNRPEQRADVRQ